MGPPAVRAASLLLVFALAKAVIVVVRLADGGGRALWSPWTPLGLLQQDVWVALMFAGCELLLERIRRPAPARWAGRALWACYAAAAAYTAINVPVARVFSTPLTYPLLHAAGGTLADSLVPYFTPANLLSVAVVLAGAAIGPALLLRVRPRRLGVVAALTVVPLLLGPTARARVELRGLHRNALLAIASSTLAHRRHPRPDEPRLSAPPLPEEGQAADLSRLQGTAAGRSVVWVVLESTAALYLRPYGADRDPTPNLSALGAGGIVFESIYAAFPESIKGLYSMLCSFYPALHTEAGDYAARRLPCSSLAQRFAAAGYRTGLFHSGWFLYLGMNDIVNERGFQVLKDAGGIGGKYATSFGVDEETTVRTLLSFIDARPGEPFFAMYLPIAGHHPYAAPGPRERPRPFGGGGELERYLNDLYFGDMALGLLIGEMKKRGLYERTLWVVSGDHGEAFHQHEGNFAHTLFLYEENVHVPLVMAAPGLVGMAALQDRQRRAPQVGSVIDIAPTILALLGLAAPERYQGRSLLAPVPGWAASLTDHTQPLLGLRHGGFKLIYDTDSGRSELFDLGQDPGERHDVAGAQPGRVARYRDHLLSWSARQRALVSGD